MALKEAAQRQGRKLLEAAKFMANVSAPGLYDMAQLVT